MYLEEVQSVLFNGHDNLDHDNHADGDGWEALSRDGDAVKLINRMIRLQGRVSKVGSSKRAQPIFTSRRNVSYKHVAIEAGRC